MDKVSNEYAQLAQLEMAKIRATVEKLMGKRWFQVELTTLWSLQKK